MVRIYSFERKSDLQLDLSQLRPPPKKCRLALCTSVPHSKGKPSVYVDLPTPCSRHLDAYSMPRSVQIKAVAAIAGLTLDEPSGYVHYTTNKTPEFLAKFASGKVPAFEAKDGFTLFEGTAIARYREYDDFSTSTYTLQDENPHTITVIPVLILRSIKPSLIKYLNRVYDLALTLLSSL